MFEVWLSSEDTGAYGIDLGISIADLLKEIPSVIPKESVCSVLKSPNRIQ